jgi:hypothetical protein
MITHKPISQIIAENQLFTPRNATFLAELESLHRILRNARSEQEERKVVAEMPRGVRINGVMSDEEVRRFFSFLYKETSSNGKPFITKEVFDIVFKNGLTIPDKPLVKKYKFNCSLASPRKIVDMGIHLLIQKHSGGKKAQFLKFLGSYFEEYSDALVSPRKLEMLASNINGKISPRNKIDFEMYLPKRYRECQKPN